MTDLWVVVLNAGTDLVIYGPTEDEDTATDFAKFLTAEVDPATAYRLRSPTRELLAFWSRSHEEWAREGMAMAADPDPDYGKDLDEDEEHPF